MKNLAFALLLTGAPAAAQQSAAPDLENAHNSVIAETIKNLALLQENSGVVVPEKLDALASELKKMNFKIKDALGAELLERAAAKEKEAENVARAAAAKIALQTLRVQLQAEYAEKGGVYPTSPASLVAQPAALHLPDHSQTAEVTVITSNEHDKDFTGAVTDSGAWLYFSDPGSVHYGMLLIDCNHKDLYGTEFYKY